MNKQELNRFIDKISPTGPGGVEKIKRVLKEVLDKESEGKEGEEDITETSYSDLKTLRDNGQLIPGHLYRITDYVTTTIQEGTRSAGHQFDIIVQAITENVISEDARAIQHKFEIPKEAYNVTSETDLIHFGEEEYQGVVYQRYTTLDMDIINGYYLIDFNNINDANPEKGYKSTIYCNYYVVDGDYLNGLDEGEVVAFKQNVHELFYFSNSNLAAWKLKYCLDNDTDRFAWASNIYLHPYNNQPMIRVGDDPEADTYIYVRYPEADSNGKFAWVYGRDSDGKAITDYIKDYNPDDYDEKPFDVTDLIYTDYENVYIGETLDMSGTPCTISEISGIGKGVIYQMKDEHGNDCPYDFKNIMFSRRQADYPNWFNRMFGQDFTSSEAYFYTFSWINQDFSIDDTSVVGKLDDEGILEYAINNTIKSTKTRINVTKNELLRLNNIILVSSWHFDDTVYYGTKNNSFSYKSNDCTFGGIFNDNIFDAYFQQNVLLGWIESNKSFGNVVRFEYNESIQGKIIYTNNNTVEIKNLNDAFSET